MRLFFYDLRTESTSFKQLPYPALYTTGTRLYMYMYADGHNNLQAKKKVLNFIFLRPLSIFQYDFSSTI
jgi:hypothetical protein